jgi:hypothetical protein
MKEFSEDIYDRWLDEVFAPAVRNFNKKEAMKRFWAICKEEMWKVDPEDEEESRENENTIDTNNEEIESR